MIGCIHVFTPQAPGKNLHHSNEIKVEIVANPPGDTFLRALLQKPRVGGLLVGWLVVPWDGR